MSTEFTPIFLFLLVAIAIGLSMMIASAVLGPHKLTKVKQMPYESGMNPFGDARQRFDVRYYLIAIVFLLFDVELLFLYPWAVAQWSGGVPVATPDPSGSTVGIAGIPAEFRSLVFWEIQLFIVILAAALAYAWKKGVFEMALGSSDRTGALAAGAAGPGSNLTVKPAGAVDVPENTILTTADAVVNWCRKYSLWPMPFATACCGIELMAVGASRFDIARFGAEVMRFSPRQCDLMIVAGRVAMKKMMPVLQRIWLQMPEPKWCISMGACASTGGVFDTYAVVQGIDRFLPVDVYIPGCPPRPEQILRALMDLQAKIQKGGSLFGTGLPEMDERQRFLEEKRNVPAGYAISQERGDEDRFGYRLPGGPGRLGIEETR